MSIPPTIVPARARVRRKRHQPASAAPVPVSVELVGADHGTEFNWFLFWQFSGPIPPSLTLADVLGLTAGNTPPAAIVDRGDNWLFLQCHCEDGVGDTWLVLPGGSPAFVPGQTGIVQEI